MGLVKLWSWIKTVRRDALLLFFAWKNHATPKELKSMILLVLLYLISPLDLVPDVVPFAGLVDDMVLVPAAIAFLSRLLPPTVLADAQAKQSVWDKRLPYLAVWFAILTVCWAGVLIWLIVRAFSA